jgi:hypothetical protein
MGPMRQKSRRRQAFRVWCGRWLSGPPIVCRYAQYYGIQFDTSDHEEIAVVGHGEMLHVNLAI